MIKSNFFKRGFLASMGLLGSMLAFSQQPKNQEMINLTDLSAFRTSGITWSVVANVLADFDVPNALKSSKGLGVLMNLSSSSNGGSDLYTLKEYGSIVLELDYMMAKGANSGIYLQGNYEVQIEDSWGVTTPSSSTNGGLYGRWDDSRPEGEKVFEGSAPRQNVSKAPGLWQHIKIIFQASKFDAGGNKIQNAKMISVELNGVLIHENVELYGSTRGAAGKEKATGSLRLQGDHGSVAFRNIKISDFSTDVIKAGRQDADPIYIDAPTNTMIRSFVDVVPGVRSVHAISVGGPQKIAFSYDLDNGTLLKGWHGEFVDATPMWDGRGNGTSRPLGSVTRFTTKPVLAISKLASTASAWITDTTGTGFRTKGYVMDNQERPEFKYTIYGAKVTDAVKIMANGRGLTREITLDQPTKDLYFLLGEVANIEEISKDLYIVDDKSYYLQFTAGQKPIIREVNGKKQVIMPIAGKLNYSILF